MNQNIKVSKLSLLAIAIIASVSSCSKTRLSDYIYCERNPTTLYSGTFTTRPLKLGSSLQLKTIHQILHLFDTANGKIALRIYGSNDCRNWCELHSLHGKPWKYYTLSYKLSNMLATDAFAGTVVDFQPLFTEKMR